MLGALARAGRVLGSPGTWRPRGGTASSCKRTSGSPQPGRCTIAGGTESVIRSNCWTATPSSSPASSISTRRRWNRPNWRSRWNWRTDSSPASTTRSGGILAVRRGRVDPAREGLRMARSHPATRWRPWHCCVWGKSGPGGLPRSGGRHPALVRPANARDAQAVPYLLGALDFWLAERSRIVIAGDPADPRGPGAPRREPSVVRPEPGGSGECRPG